MKLVVMIIITQFLFGCGTCQRTVTAWTGGLTYKCSKAGTEYVQSDSGIALLIGQDGKPVLCDEK